jgi:four helix bundle protein
MVKSAKKRQLALGHGVRDGHNAKNISRVADFKNLLVWQKSHKLSIATIEAVESIHGNAGTLIRNQLIRSILSIQSNISEGSAKRSDREFARYIRISLGSAAETENHLLLLKDLNFLDLDVFESLNAKLDQVGKLLTAFEKRLSDDASSE